MPREGLACGRGAFGHHEKLRTVVRGTLSMEYTGIGTPVDWLVINDRELANLQWFGQKADRPSDSRVEHGDHTWLPRPDFPAGPASTSQPLYHRLSGQKQRFEGVTRRSNPLLPEWIPP